MFYVIYVLWKALFVLASYELRISAEDHLPCYDSYHSLQGDMQKRVYFAIVVLARFAALRLARRWENSLAQSLTYRREFLRFLRFFFPLCTVHPVETGKYAAISIVGSVGFIAHIPLIEGSLISDARLAQNAPYWVSAELIKFADTNRADFKSVQRFVRDPQNSLTFVRRFRHLLLHAIALRSKSDGGLPLLSPTTCYSKDVSMAMPLLDDYSPWKMLSSASLIRFKDFIRQLMLSVEHTHGERAEEVFEQIIGLLYPGSKLVNLLRSEDSTPDWYVERLVCKPLDVYEAGAFIALETRKEEVGVPPELVNYVVAEHDICILAISPDADVYVNTSTKVVAITLNFAKPYTQPTPSRLNAIHAALAALELPIRVQVEATDKEPTYFQKIRVLRGLPSPHFLDRKLARLNSAQPHND